MVGPDGEEHLAKAPKAAIAGAILDRIERFLDGPGPSSR